jgi:hypothetical protein
LKAGITTLSFTPADSDTGWTSAVHPFIWWNARVPGEDRLPLVLGLAASLPIVVAMGHAIAVGWVPIGDDGMIAVRAYDVFSAHSPLVGMPSSGPTGILAEQVYHPGPLLFWLLAVPAHFLGALSLPLTVGVVNVACVIGCVALARRRGGIGLAVGVAFAIALMLFSLPSDAYAGVWNPAAPLMPLTLLFFLAWSIACGEHRLLPLAVLIASFAAQSHLIFTLPAAAALLVAVSGLALRRRRVPLRWVGATVAVGLVCWSAPLGDQLFNEPGNLGLIRKAASVDTKRLGLGDGRRALVQAVGIRPWWLSEPRTALQRVGNLGRRPALLTIGSGLLVVAALVAAAILGLRRKRGDVVAACALALAQCAALVFATASIPWPSVASVGYALWWASPVGMFAWIALIWSAIVLLPVELWSGVRRRLPARPVLATGVALVAAAAVAVTLSIDWHAQPFDQVREVSANVDAAVDDAKLVRVDASFGEGGYFVGRGFQFATIYALRRAGHSVTAPSVGELIGSQYKRTSAAATVNINAGGDPSGQGKAVATVDVPPDRFQNPFSKIRRVTVTASVKRSGAGASTAWRAR